MRLSATTIYSLYNPSRCELRPWLAAHGEPPAEPGPFEQVLIRLGRRHEQAHLAQLGPYTDLSAGTLTDRAARTGECLRRGDRVLYQPVFIAHTRLEGVTTEIVGIPDFLIRDKATYRVRDCKLALHADEQRHPEILRQAELYGWLFTQGTGTKPVALEIVLGTSNIVKVPYDGGAAARVLLAQLSRTLRQDEPAYEPVGWSKCQGCGSRPQCWAEAEEARDVAVVYGVDQSLARALRAEGVITIDDLLDRFNERALADFTRLWGERTQRVGKIAGRILDQARAVASKRALPRTRPALPDSDNYVMFDVEGMPPHLDELDKVYLWGLRVLGRQPSPYQAAVADFGLDGDRQGWRDFLGLARGILARHGDIPFVHWHHYETTKLRTYISRYGDLDGTAARVVRNCVDLLPITRDAIVLPTPSYSLKVVERWTGFQRTLAEYGGDWSMAKYIEATETGDEAERQAIMQEILGYNREDLEATWAVLRWLEAGAPQATPFSSPAIRRRGGFPRRRSRGSRSS